MYKHTAKQHHHKKNIPHHHVYASQTPARKQRYTILKHIQCLLENNATKDEWEFFIQATNWDIVSKQTLRVAALQVYNHIHGQRILQIALNKHALRIEDFEKVLMDWKNINLHTTEQVMCHAHTTALQSGRDHKEAAQLKNAFANAGSPSWFAIRSMYD